MAKQSKPAWQPSTEDTVNLLREQNPWWNTRAVPAALARSVARPLAQRLAPRLMHDEPRRYQLILGPRRVGKTTCLYQTVAHLLREGVDANRLWWLRLDHPLLMEEPLDLFAKLAVRVGNAAADRPVYLFLDELAYAREWDLWLKTFYDEHWPIRIAGSSSSTAVLRNRRRESGVGRWEEQYLAPYLFGEYLALIDRAVDIPTAPSLAATLDACATVNYSPQEIEKRRRQFLLIGGFPELLLPTKQMPQDEQSLILESQRTLRSDAVERAIYKDIPQAFGVDNPMQLERVLYTLAGQVTGILSPANLCRDLSGLSQPTFDRYLSYLTEVFLVFTLPNYSGSEQSRQKRGRKLYFVDGAVRNAALQRGIGPLTDTVEMGVLIENMVAAHLHALGQQSQVRLYHWRDGNDEVDLIYDHPTDPVAVEVGLSPKHSRAGLLRLLERHERFRGRCFLVAPDLSYCRAGDDGVGTIPLDLFLVAVSAQAQYHLDQRLIVAGDRRSSPLPDIR